MALSRGAGGEGRTCHFGQVEALGEESPADCLPQRKAAQPIRAVLLDKDGTLFDFQATWGAWTRGLIEAESEGDPLVAARLAEALGYDMEAERFLPSSVVIASTTETVAGVVLPLLPRPATREELMARLDARSRGAPQVEAAPLREVLGRLRGMGLKVGVATNDSEEPARVHLRGVMDLLDFVAGFDSGHGAKPGPGQCLAFAAAVGVEPAACVMVGDSLHDLAAARAAGMVGVGVLTGPAGRDTLEGAAAAVLGSIAELPAWIEGREAEAP